MKINSNSRAPIQFEDFYRAGSLKTILVFLSLVASNLSQAQLALDFSATLELIQNPLRLPEPGQDELLSTLTFGAQLERQTQFVDTNFSYNASRLEYAEDLLSDRQLIEGNGVLTFKIVPDLFSWRLLNTRSNQLIDISQPDISDNQQIIDYTATGPELTLIVNSASFINMSAEWGLVNYEEAEYLNQKRNVYNFNFTRRLGSRFSASIRSNFTNTNFDTLDNLNYDSVNLSAGLDLIAEDYSLSLEAGEYKNRRAGQEVSFPIASVSGRYLLNSRIELSAEFSESVEDLLSDLRSQNIVDQSFIDAGIETDSNLGNSNIGNLYQSRGSSIGVTYAEESRYTFGLNYSVRRRDNIGSAGSEETERISASLQLPLGNRLSLNLTAQYSILDFSQQQRIHKRKEFRIGGSYRVRNNVNLIFFAVDSDQNGDVPEDKYHGRNIGIGLSVRR